MLHSLISDCSGSWLRMEWSLLPHGEDDRSRGGARGRIRLGCWEKERDVGEQSSQAVFASSAFGTDQGRGRCQHLVRTSTAALLLTGSVILEGSTYAHLSLIATS